MPSRADETAAAAAFSGVWLAGTGNGQFVCAFITVVAGNGNCGGFGSIGMNGMKDNLKFRADVGRDR